MRYYKCIDDDYIITIGTGAGYEEITYDEYSNLLNIIKNHPTAPEGHGYKLKTDFTWELVDGKRVYHRPESQEE